jgi:gamma-glutamylcyclotransferase (GGCT)/AIG2-like uncharacterized protein YtfP
MHAVRDLIEAANAARRRSSADVDVEDQLDSLFGTRKRLAVYGSLAPGRQNHHIVEPLGGTWSEGVVEGDLVTYGWGAALGFRALYPRAGGPAVRVHVLASKKLEQTWADLDAFEGAEYRRVLVPVWSASAAIEDSLLTVANLYEAASPADARRRQS